MSSTPAAGYKKAKQQFRQAVEFRIKMVTRDIKTAKKNKDLEEVLFLQGKLEQLEEFAGFIRNVMLVRKEDEFDWVIEADPKGSRTVG